MSLYSVTWGNSGSGPLEDLGVSIWLQNGHTEIQAGVLQEPSGISGEEFAGGSRSVEGGQNERVIQYLLHGVVQNLGCKNENSTSQCVVVCGLFLLAFKGAGTRYIWLFPSESSSSRWQRQQHRDMHQEGTAGHVPPLKSGVAWAQVPRYQEDLDVDSQPTDCWLFFHFLMLYWQAPFKPRVIAGGWKEIIQWL